MACRQPQCAACLSETEICQNATSCARNELKNRKVGAEKRSNCPFLKLSRRIAFITVFWRRTDPRWRSYPPASAGVQKTWEELCGRCAYADPAQLITNTNTMTLLNKLFEMRELGRLSFQYEQTDEGGNRWEKLEKPTCRRRFVWPSVA